MKDRTILAAIAISAGLFSAWAGLRLDPTRLDEAVPALVAPVKAIVNPVQGFIAVSNKAVVERVRLAGMVREVTAYNVGVREQTSEKPCIGASGKDLCRLVDQGRRVCAANFVKLGTVLHIEQFGECVVLDRMHRRFGHRVDIAMRQDEVDEAIEFGLQKRLVAVKN